MDIVKDGGKFLFSKILVYYAYSFTNGPWKSMWVRYGYDPLQDPNARFLQILNIRISQDTLQSYLNKLWPTVQNYGGYVNVDFPSCEVSDNSVLVSEMRSKKTGLTISFFNVEVTQQFNINFVEFRDQRIVEFLGTVCRMERVGKFGW